jgi:hypothetical protein
MAKLARFALTIGTAALVAGCGAQGTMPQSFSTGLARLQPTLALRVPRGTGEVQYVSEYYEGTILEFDYPKGESSIGSIGGYSGGFCTKGARTFWVATGSEVVEFKAGGTSPIRELKAAGGACAIDAASGNLASVTSGGVIIFHHARGKGKVYNGGGLSEAFFDGYDNGGNLFLDGFTDSDHVGLAELPKGRSEFRMITTSNTVEFPGSVQWDGTYLTVFDQQANAFYQYSVRGTMATLRGTVSLTGSSDCAATWIAQPYVYCADAGNDEAEVFKYPAGGSPIATLTGPFQLPIGIVSLRVR